MCMENGNDAVLCKVITHKVDLNEENVESFQLLLEFLIAYA